MSENLIVVLGNTQPSAGSHGEWVLNPAGTQNPYSAVCT
jgi:hypothetical protein